MISITKYWETFKDCVDNLPISVENQEYSRQLATANKLIEIGVGIEQLGLTEIKEVVNQLHEKAKLFEYRVSFNTPKQNYTFYLPKITSSESLIFAIIYYQHLHNYHNVNYEGSIIWPMSNLVIRGVNDKKITTQFQSKAMLKEIQAYCQSYNIPLNESQLLKTDGESVKDYIARVTKTFSQEPLAHYVIDSQQSYEPVTTDEIQRLGNSLDLFKNHKNQLNDKIDSFSKKLTEFHLATQNYLKLNIEWNNTSVFTQFYYWIISWFYPVPQLQKLRQAKEQLIDVEAALNQEFFPSESDEIYRITLKNQLTEISVEFERTQEQLNQLKVEQLKLQLQPQEKNNIVTPNNSIIATEAPEHKDNSLEIDDEDTGILSSDFGGYYSFFRENLPSSQTMQAVAVGTVAIVTQQLLFP